MNLLPRVWIEIFVIIGICILIYFLTNSNFDKNYVIVYIGLISFALIRIIPSIMRISNSYQQLRYTTATDRKRKLLEKQKKGKARSKQFGKYKMVVIERYAFLLILTLLLRLTQ